LRFKKDQTLVNKKNPLPAEFLGSSSTDYRLTWIIKLIL